MKYIALALFLSLSVGLFAQSDRPAEIAQAVSEQTALYDLTAEQQAEMLVIQERRFNNLDEIEVLRESDYKYFLQKRRAIRLNTDGSIRRMLSPEQRSIHDQQLIAYRQATSDLIRQLRQEGKSKEEIELIVLERG